MKKYYIYRNLKKEGPFSLQELNKKKIHPETFIWHEGLDDWAEAVEIKEIKDYLEQSPPPTPFERNKIKAIKVLSSACIFFLKLICSIIYIFGVLSLFDFIFPGGFISNYLELIIIIPFLILGIRFIYRPSKRLKNSFINNIIKPKVSNIEKLGIGIVIILVVTFIIMSSICGL